MSDWSLERMFAIKYIWCWLLYSVVAMVAVAGRAGTGKAASLSVGSLTGYRESVHMLWLESTMNSDGHGFIPPLRSRGVEVFFEKYMMW